MSLVQIQLDKQVYLLFGEENWLKNQYIQTLNRHFSPQGEDVMNTLSLEGKEVSLSKIEDFCETMPFFNPYKIVYLKNTGFFKAGKKEDGEKMWMLLEKLPEYMVVIFVENEVDKRNKGYKWIHKQKQAIACDELSEEAIVPILQDFCKGLELTIQKTTLVYFVQNMPKKIETMFGELEKLKAYAQKEEVTKKMIEELCVFDVEQVVFTLLDHMVNKNTAKALGVYKKLMESKESPIGVLVLIARQYRMILQTKYLMRTTVNANSIGRQIGLPYFVVNKTMDHAKKLNFTLLQNILGWCLETDQMIKTGKQEPILAVETLIVKCICSL